jgi:hypothetical protein
MDLIQEDSLRDYFAAQALIAILSKGAYDIPQVVAEKAYLYADAMIEERSKKD